VSGKTKRYTRKQLHREHVRREREAREEAAEQRRAQFRQNRNWERITRTFKGCDPERTEALLNG
jgi:hypothetical protein